MSRYGEAVAIAVGQDNQDNLLRFHLLSKPLFQDYKTYLKKTYLPYEERVMSGARRFKKVGLPTATLLFEALTSDEFQYLLDTFFLAGREEGEVTLRTLNIQTNTWGNYNAILEKPVPTENQWNGYEYRDIIISFYDLVSVS